MPDPRESETVVLTNYVWEDGRALFKWSDGTVDEVRCSLAAIMERSANIVGDGGCKLQ